ncbi:hypothetical protein PybrP1_010579 [[Pythium] brassicae (nom. inval.)]|nr:hypothetical protein PybrP1_010579 [[Pythium] brassicae (nom. inval.)]
MKLFAALAAIASLSTTADAHSWLTKPVSRETGARSDIENKVGCPDMNPGKSTSFKAGETIDVRYWRNNHLGGFIRWAMVPKGEESHDSFDKNVFHYSCRESGPECIPKGNQGTNMYAGDSSGDNTIPCGDKITLPDWLPAGDYVLQWTWFGVGSSFGNIGWAEPQFRSCADIKLTTKGAKSAAPTCPTFVGGDRVTKMKSQGDDKCFYFYTTDIVDSQYKGSNTDYASKYRFGVPAAIQKCGGGGGSSNSTTPAAAPKPSATPKSPAKTPKAPAKTPKPASTKKPSSTPKPASTKKPSSTPKTPAVSPKPAATTKAPVAGDATKKPADKTKAPAAATKSPGCKVKGARK